MQQIGKRTPRVAALTRCGIASLVAAVAAMLSAGRANAITYQFVTTVPAGTSVPAGTAVSVYLQEGLASGETSLISAENGLFGVGFGVSYVTSPGSLSLISISPNSTAFDGGFSTGNNVSATQMGLLEYVASTTTGASLSFYQTQNGITYNRLLLGSVTLDTSLVGFPAVFQIGPFDNNTGNVVTMAGTELDSLITPTNFGVFGAVPEPTGLALLALPAMGLRRRR
jgi:hypothetical protein